MAFSIVKRSGIRLATFDVTNTLLKFKSPVGESYSRVGEMFNVKTDPVKLEGAFRANYETMKTKFPNFGRNSEISSKVWWNEVVQSSFKSVAPVITKSQLDQISACLFRMYTTDSCWLVRPGVFEELPFIKKHVILGVISNFDERLETVLASTGLRPFFQFVIASYNVNCEKPQKKIFDIALTKCKLKDIKASECVHIGNDIHYDYNGALNAGWNALLLKKNEKDVNIDIKSVSSMKEISDYILNY